MMLAIKQHLLTVTLRAPSAFVYDKLKDGWDNVENVELVGDPTLELAEFLKEDEFYVSGYAIRERAKAMNGLTGQLHAERLLGQQETIPNEWRQFYLLFPGTVWHYSDGDMCIPYLGWDGSRWYLDWCWLDNGFRSHYRVVRISQ